MKKTVLFRVDGGNVYSVAMGHVYRCLRIADELIKRDLDICFIMRDYPGGPEFVEKSGYRVCRLESDMDMETTAEQTVRSAGESGVVLVCDLRQSSEAYIAWAKQKGIKSVIYKDEPMVEKNIYDADVVFNVYPGINLPVQTGTFESCKYFFGADYIVLDSSLETLKKESFSSRINTLFVCFGGADPCNISSRVLLMLLNRDYEFSITLALGPAFKNEGEIEEILRRMDLKKRVRVIGHSDRFFNCFADHDAAVTAGGTMVYEALALNLPVMALPSIQREAMATRWLMDGGLVCGIPDDVAGVGNPVIEAALEDFINSPGKREQLYANMSHYVLSEGTKRVAREIFRCLEG